MWLTKYTKEVIREGKRVRWPNGEAFWPAFIVTLVITVFAAVVLMLEDNLAQELLNALETVFKGFGG